MRYLVTGGSGFIGSHLVEKLISLGNDVIVIDNSSSSSQRNLNSVLNQIQFIKGDILELQLLEKYIPKVDHVVHLAAALGVFNIVNNPLQSLQTNLRGTELILEVADKHSKPVFIASTSEIYGKNEKVPLNEEDDRIIGHPLKSRWSYSEAKAVDESLAYFYFLERGLPIRIIRFFNTVGPRQIGEYGMVLPRFISAGLKGEPLEVYGSSNQVRCFCHVNDAVNALLLVLESSKAIGQVFNVGNNEPISILDLAKKVISITQSRSEIVRISYEKAYPEGFEDMKIRVPDLSKINSVLGWSPKISLNQIIADIVYFQTSSS